jgi:hypothetical protein
MTRKKKDNENKRQNMSKKVKFMKRLTCSYNEGVVVMALCHAN